MPEYDSIMRRIGPEAIADEVTGPCALAKQSFQMRSNTVGSFQDLVDVLTRFVQNFMRVTKCGEWSEEIAFGRAVEALRRRNLSLQSIYYGAKTGSDGGMRKIIDTVAEQLETERANLYIDLVLAKEVDQQDYDQIEELMTVYVQKFARHLPFQLRSVPALMADWKAVLIETSKMMGHLQSHIGKP